MIRWWLLSNKYVIFIIYLIIDPLLRSNLDQRGFWWIGVGGKAILLMALIPWYLFLIVDDNNVHKYNNNNSSSIADK